MRKQVNLNLKTYLLADKLRGTKSFPAFFQEVLNKYRKVKQLQIEIENLKQQLQKEEQLNLSSEKDLAAKYPCLTRFELDNLYYCVPRKAHMARLETLKICSHCLCRHTDEMLTVKRKVFVTCGAKEHYDRKKGWMVYCERYFQGSWVTTEDCKRVQCQEVKEVQIA